MTELEARIILTLAECNMNVCETSRRLHYHRNTIRYHLDNVKKSTGRDPLNFHDLIMLEKIAHKELEEET